MAITWLIKKNADTPVTLAASGVTACLLTLRANGVDELRFSQSNDWAAAPAWPFATKVCLIRRDSAASPTDRCVFVGTVESIPRQAQGAGPETITYHALGPAHDLQLCEYSQAWHYTDAEGADATIYEPTVVLGEDNTGARLASGAVITDAVSYAIGRGVSIAAGTIAAGVSVPLDERDNIKCWDAITSMLRYTPDYVLWFDYDNTVDGVYVPALNVTAPASMATVTKAIENASAAAAHFTPRTDLRVPGILITYRWTAEIDGQSVKYRSTDSAGDINSPRRVSLVYDMEGVRATFLTQAVEVAAYPSDWTSSAGKTLLKQLCPWLANLADADWSVVSCSRQAGSSNYPSRLLNGAVPEWTDKHSQRDTFFARVTYKTLSDDTDSVLDQGSKDLTFTLTSTDAETKTYRRISDWVAPEEVVPGLAAALYASWNRLHYDGTVTFHEQDCPLDLLPGMLLSCTGGLTDWASMAAVVQDVTCDIGSGTTTVKTGTCGRLEADNIIAIYRAARGRRYSYSRAGRTNPASTDGNQVDCASGTPNDLIADAAPASLRSRFAVEADDASSNTHLIDLDPSAVAFATAGHATAQLIKIREVMLPYDDSGTIKAKLAQVLCSASYGDAVDLGGSRPADPASPTELGQNSEGTSDNAVSTAYDGPAGTAGVSVWVCTRLRYDHTAVEPRLLAFMSKLTWPAAIAPTVSGQTQVTIDTPVELEEP